MKFYIVHVIELLAYFYPVQSIESVIPTVGPITGKLLTLQVKREHPTPITINKQRFQTRRETKKPRRERAKMDEKKENAVIECMRRDDA